MGISGNFTFFSPSSGGSGSDSGDYVKQVFADVSVPASNNTGFSSTLARNPFGQFFANDDAPKFEYKTLWVKDLILIEDRNLWVNGKATYEVVFTQNQPGVFAYVYGNCRLRNSENGLSVDLRNAGDGFGMTTTGRKVHWFLNPSQTASQNAVVLVDGALNTQSINYGSYPPFSASGINKYYAGQSSLSSETNDIHDYRLQASNNLTLSVAGMGVFFENVAGVIDQFPGTTYLDKEKVTTTTGVGLTLPVLSGRVGAVATVFKTASSNYTLTTNERTTIESIAVGSSGTNQVTVTTGQGASFKIGDGVAMTTHGGGTFYLGAVSNVSTDTLTLGPTLLLGVSGPIWKLWSSGLSALIFEDVYNLYKTFEPASANVPAETNSFGNPNVNVPYYQDPENDYRAWGQSVIIDAIDGYQGLRPAAAGAWLQIEGRFSALEAVWATSPGVTSIIHATFSINGVPSVWSELSSFTSVIKQTIFAGDGPADWNQVRIGFGGSFMNTVLTSLNLLRFSEDIGSTIGQLGSISLFGTPITRPAVNATLMLPGVFQRVYSDQIYYTGAWTKGVTTSAAGGVQAVGSSTNSVALMRYWGKDFGIIGSAGASFSVSLDGVAFGASMNLIQSVATLGFHALTITSLSPSLNISAIDFVRPRGELMNLQNYAPQPELAHIPQVFEQANTPLNPVNGDIWAQGPADSGLWVYLFNRWNLLQVLQTSDDPNLSSMFTAGGQQ